MSSRFCWLTLPDVGVVSQAIARASAMMTTISRHRRLHAQRSSLMLIRPPGVDP
jgi:hypothetical protein